MMPSRIPKLKGTTRREQRTIRREESVSSGYQSMKSDNSKEEPINFTGDSRGRANQRVGEWLTQKHPAQPAAEAPPPPGQIQFLAVGSDAVSLSWGAPEGMDSQTLSFRVTWDSDTAQRSSKEQQYSERMCFSICADSNPCSSGTDSGLSGSSFTLSWREPHGLDQTPYHFLVSYSSPGTEPQFISTDSLTVTLSHLQPGTEHTASVYTELENGEQSEAASKSICTKPSAPGRVRVEEVRSRSVRLRWDTPTEMEGVSYTFSISYSCDGEEPKECFITAAGAGPVQQKSAQEKMFCLLCVKDIPPPECQCTCHIQELMA
ncbi:hypothetical protein MATL_G00220440 [Megalops atlanticus]|uniref:Fibronectin type-III domain-containing protein n=1 Tax=Megalops atlanticus TaxID=7932 RepID=A0A9D3SWT3_MEGAT|nr:hypothetical protein MATL_G00220440 [Megalops atlanticus]